MHLKRRVGPEFDLKLVGESDNMSLPDHPKLVLISNEVTTASRIKFPADADLFWAEPDAVKPAKLVRASMSVPGFYEPVTVPLKQMNAAMKQQWLACYRYTGPMDDDGEAALVDGGVVSNVPLDTLHQPHRPRLPTFGVRLGFNRHQSNKTHTIYHYAFSLFDSILFYFDSSGVRSRVFLEHKRIYEPLVQAVDTQKVNWLNFELQPKAQQQLFVQGVKAAGEFLRGFDWVEHQSLRAELSRALSKIWLLLSHA